MKIVVDANRIIAATIRDGVTRQIFFFENLNFIAPAYLQIEIAKYESLLLSKTKMNQHELKEFLALIYSQIKFFEEETYSTKMRKAQKLISDAKDVAYIALALSQNASGIWTHDAGFKEQEEIQIFTNVDLLRFSGK